MHEMLSPYIPTTYVPFRFPVSELGEVEKVQGGMIRAFVTLREAGEWALLRGG